MKVTEHKRDITEKSLTSLDPQKGDLKVMVV